MVEHGGDGILGLGAEARDQSQAPAMIDERALKQVIGAQEIGLIAQIAQHGDGLGPAILGFAQHLPERGTLRTRLGQIVKRGFVPAADG